MMNFQEQFLSRLQKLPERETRVFPDEEMPESYRSAAVLIPLWPEADGSVKVAFTQRVDSLPSHKGQVSFPGGGTLPADQGPKTTALRETREELGIEPEDIRVMGRLDDAWSRYGFHIVPFVGWLDTMPEFIPDYKEVAGVIIADVQTLMQAEASYMHEFSRDGIQRRSQAFRWQGGYVWGVTADILLELFLWVRGEKSNRMDARLKLVRGEE